MKTLERRYYDALKARDPRFDGLFFVGVTTTGIYCRSLCPARTPAFERCRFFDTPSQAEKQGFRACFRCRPELAPGDLSTLKGQDKVAKAVGAIQSGFLIEHTMDDLAKRLGMSDRHFRRRLKEALGVTPIELAQSHRLLLAKQLLQDTKIPMSDVAFGAGFRSIRRFNALFKARYGRSPTDIRRGVQRSFEEKDGFTIRLDYRPPMQWEMLLAFLDGRSGRAVESIEGPSYRRTVNWGERGGWISVSPVAGKNALAATVSFSLLGRLTEVVAQLRGLFDLDAQPAVIIEAFENASHLQDGVAQWPGMRIPGAFDAFETLIRTILGQQISVKGASTLFSRFVEKFGRSIETPFSDLTHCFPTPEQVAAADVEAIRSIGLPGRRAASIHGIATALAEGKLILDGLDNPLDLMARLKALPGIGDWTTQYLAMRVLRWPDAFPAGDLILKRYLKCEREKDVLAIAEAWRPFRAYAAIYLWELNRRGLSP